MCDTIRDINVQQMDVKTYLPIQYNMPTHNIVRMCCFLFVCIH